MTDAELNTLAHSLAYEAAVSAIECATLNGTDESGDWMVLDSDPINPSEESDTHALRGDFQFLDARGLLVRHASKAEWIQILDESEATR